MQLSVYLHLYLSNLCQVSGVSDYLFVPTIWNHFCASNRNLDIWTFLHIFQAFPSPAWLRSCVLNAAWLGGGAGCGQAGGARLRGPGRWKIMCSNFVQAVAVLAAVREGEGAVHCRQSIQLAPPPANRDGNESSRSFTVPES